MILTFSEPKFVNLLLKNIKGTTFRVDKTNRWKVGMIAHMWMHNPCNVRLNPHHIKNDTIYSIEYVLFIPIKGILKIYLDDTYTDIEITLSVKRQKNRLDGIARIDGFKDFAEMKEWFIKKGYTDPAGYRMKRLWFSGYFDNLPF